MNAQTHIKIGSWTASPALNLLERENRAIKIERRAMDVLAHLAERSGEVVSVEELLAAVWQGVVVSDSSVYLAIKQLRQALAIPGDDTVYIETIPKRGYRLKAPVERLAPERASGNARPLPVAHDGSARDSAVSARPRPSHGSRAPWLLAAGLATALCAALVPAALYFSSAPGSPARPMRLEVSAPGYVSGGLAISPDGEHIAYTAALDGVRQIWLRPIDEPAARALPGTVNARHVFWSPDSRSLAFVAEHGTLKRIDIAGGPAYAVADASTLAWGSGAWSRDGTILHTTQATGFPIARVPAAGGALEAMTAPALERGETGHFVPRLLPDDEHFVYIGGGPSLPTATVYLGSRTSSLSRVLLSVDDPVKTNQWMNLAFANGFLLYVRGGTLMAQPFDPDAREVRGEALALAEDVDEFSASETGVVVYRTRGAAAAAESRLVWFDRSGQRLDADDVQQAAYIGPALSPDGRRVAVTVLASHPGVSDVWIVDAERAVGAPLTFGDAKAAGAAIWSPDGARVAFSSGHGDIPFLPNSIFERDALGAAPEKLLFSVAAGELVWPLDWSRDGRFIVFARSENASVARSDIWALPASGNGPAFPVIESAFRKHGASSRRTAGGSLTPRTSRGAIRSSCSRSRTRRRASGR